VKNLSREIDHNYKAFAAAWHSEMTRVYAAMETEDTRFLGCYKRLVSLQAWRTELLEALISEGALRFFLEAQNDGLVSLVLARLGSHRAALQSLRSCLENVLFATFYMDHPVELRLWEKGKHRLGFKELESYFQSHPDLIGVDLASQVFQELSTEYSTLSRAVHGSAVSFRMNAAETGTHLWSDERARIGKYATRQSHAIAAINLLLLLLFRSHLQGAARLNLRKVISYAIPQALHKKIKTASEVSLLSP
jgi:hypothetical protein